MNKIISMFYIKTDNNTNEYYVIDEVIKKVVVSERSKNVATYGIFNFFAEAAKATTEFVGIFNDGFYCVNTEKDKDKELNGFSAYNEYFINNYKDDDLVLVRPDRLDAFKSVRNYKEHLIYDHSSIDLVLKAIETVVPEYSAISSEYLLNINRINLGCFCIKTQILRDGLKFVFEIMDYVEKELAITDKYPLNKLNIYEQLSMILMEIFIYANRGKYSVLGNQLLTNKPFIISNEIEPAFSNENVVNVVFSSSDYFSVYLGVCLASLIKHANRTRFYDIIVMERGITEGNKNRILKLADGISNISIRFCNISKDISKYNFFINSERISQETYYGLLVPHILENYKKAIIMDCDMIVMQDVAELFDNDLNGYVAGGVKDAILQGWLNNPYNDTRDYYEQIHAKDPTTYVNGGLLLIDFDKYREMINLEMLFDSINNNQYRVVDQDCFNTLLEGYVKPLDPKWNHMVYVVGAISQAIEDSPYKVREEYFNARKNPGIIHYASENKPWNNTALDFAEEFWKTARNTDFYEILIQRLLPTSTTVTQPVSFDNRSGARKIGDMVFPKGTIRRSIAKVVLPKGTIRWKLAKEIYFIFRPDLKIYRDK